MAPPHGRENLEADLDNWVTHYEPKFFIFLRALESKEEEFMAQGGLEESERLSSQMQESWENSQFLVAYGREGLRLSTFSWKVLDERFFGRNESEDLGTLWRS